MSTRWRRRPPPRHARASVLAPARWVLPSSVAAFVALISVVVSVTVAGARPEARALPVVGPAPLAANARHVAPPPGLVGALMTAGLPDKGTGLVAAIASSAPTTLQASASAVHDFAAASALAQDGIPVTALHAYKQAAARERLLNPSCGLTWPLLAAIGRVESDHGRFAGAVLHADGLSTPPIIGIALNGHGTALIRDTDHGRLDGDPVYDHAVGPMQFIPSTWAGWGVDVDHDGVANPFDIFDATAAAAAYLCAAGGNLSTYANQVRAVRSYNDSNAYIALVLATERIYAAGAGVVVPVAPGTGATGPTAKPTLPPVNPGPPPGVGKRKHHRHRRSHAPTSSAPRSPSRTPSSPATSPSPSPSTSASSSGSTSPSGSPSGSGTTSSSASSPASSSASSSQSSAGASSNSGSSALSTSSENPPSLR